MASGIYRISFVNSESGKVYVGSTVNFTKRCGQHLSYLRKQQHHCAPLQRAFDKYGEENLRFELIEEVDKDFLIEKENEWLRRTEHKYNVALFAGPPMQGRTFTPETRAKLSAANTGKTHTPETRAKLSAAQTGRRYPPEVGAKHSAALKGIKRSPETRAKMSAAQRRRSATWKYKHTPEARAKMAAARLGKKATPESRLNMSIAQQRRFHPELFNDSTD